MTKGSRVALVKWGGSLITDKTGREEVRSSMLRRLARDLKEVVGQETQTRFLLGHGSGSFGHAAARAEGWIPGTRLAPKSAARIQDAAARLHRLVIQELLSAGLAPFSCPPGAYLATNDSEVDAIAVQPLELALASELLPVVYGDVVLDRSRVASILSTERVFLALARELSALDIEVVGAFWLGDTAGILDPDGKTIAEVTRSNVTAVAQNVSGAAAGASDVTGGMQHRLECALELSRSGIPSWILDGTQSGALSRALSSVDSREAYPGTLVDLG